MLKKWIIRVYCPIKNVTFYFRLLNFKINYIFDPIYIRIKMQIKSYLLCVKASCSSFLIFLNEKENMIYGKREKVRWEFSLNYT
jgi:SUMO ligase MMS21 Smc5/6 complex component